MQVKGPLPKIGGNNNNNNRIIIIITIIIIIIINEALIILKAQVKGPLPITKICGNILEYPVIVL